VGLSDGLWGLVLGAVVLSLAVAWYRTRRRCRIAEGELAARDAQLELIGSEVDDLIYRMELLPRPRFVFVSGSSGRLIGYSPQEHYDDPDLGHRIVHPADRHLLEDASGESVSGKLRLRWRHRDGHTVWFEQRNHVRLVDGVPAEVVGVARDVTREELDRRASESFQRLSDAVLVDKQAFGARVHGFATEVSELLEATALSIRWDDTSLQGPAEFQIGPPGEAADGSVEGGSGACSIVVALPREAPAPQVVERLLPALARDLDALRTAAARDRELRRVIQALAATASAVMLTDADGHIEWVNPAFTHVTGYAASEAIGATPRLLKSGVQSAAYYQRMWATILAGQPFADQLVDRRRDGTLYSAAVTIDPVIDQDGRIIGFIGVQKDVTADTQARQELHRRELAVLRRQSDIDQERTLLVQTISHELRTPLTVVTGAAATLDRDGLDDAARTQVRKALARATDQLLGRLEVLLAATDGINGPPARLDVGVLLNGVLSRLGPRHDVDRVRIEGRADWFGYGALAHVALRSVLENALEYSPGDSDIEVVVSRQGAGIRIGVVDHGAGVDEAFLERIDEPFLQADGRPTREHGGLGLGLYAARRAVTRLDGSMEISSDPSGTRVVLVLPDEQVPQLQG